MQFRQLNIIPGPGEIAAHPTDNSFAAYADQQFPPVSPHSSRHCQITSSFVLVQIELAMKQLRLNKALMAVVLGCLEREPALRYTAETVIAALKNLIRNKGW